MTTIADRLAAEIQRDMLVHSDFRAPPAPKPVTWPDGVTEMRMDNRTLVAIADGWITIVNHGLRFRPTEARQFGALLLAAADKVEGRG